MYVCVCVRVRVRVCVCVRVCSSAILEAARAVRGRLLGVSQSVKARARLCVCDV